MAMLGDFLPDSLKSQLITGNLKVGSVFRIFDNNTNPPKIKRFIIVGISQDSVIFATVYINTEINPYLFQTAELKALHLPVSSNNRPYLEYDSYIDCSQIIQKNKSDIKAIYEADMSCHIGDVSLQDFKKIKEIIKTTRTISRKIKERFSLFS